MILSIEIKMLLASSILGLIQLMLAASGNVMQRGLAWDLSARDKKMPDLTGVAGRLERAFKNFMETFPFFIAAIFLVQSTTLGNSLSATGAQVYFYSRVLYIPLYALGIPFVRSLVWTISMIGLLLVFSALF